jgi:hypothetical protein
LSARTWVQAEKALQEDLDRKRKKQRFGDEQGR